MISLDQLAVWVLPLLLGITLHEVAHGWMALQLGDRTAQMLGRLSLNPLRHIDPIGTVIVPLLLLYLGGFVFGWARPVPVTFENLRSPRRDMALVALAGPVANALMAVLWLGVLLAVVRLGPEASPVGMGVLHMAGIGILINTVLMVLNLLPVPPLDGSRIVSALLPPRMSAAYDRLEPYGLVILLGLILTGLISPIMRPLVEGFFQLLFWSSDTGWRYFLGVLQMRG